jgi:hypothetical protein
MRSITLRRRIGQTSPLEEMTRSMASRAGASFAEQMTMSPEQRELEKLKLDEMRHRSSMQGMDKARGYLGAAGDVLGLVSGVQHSWKESPFAGPDQLKELQKERLKREMGHDGMSMPMRPVDPMQQSLWGSSHALNEGRLDQIPFHVGTLQPGPAGRAVIYIWKHLKKDLKPVGKIELFPGLILLHSGEALLTKIIQACLSREAFCKIRSGDTLEKVRCDTPLAHVQARLRAHLYRPYFVSDKPGNVQVQERVRFPLSVLEGAEVVR